MLDRFDWDFIQRMDYRGKFVEFIVASLSHATEKHWSFPLDHCVHEMHKIYNTWIFIYFSKVVQVDKYYNIEEM